MKVSALALHLHSLSPCLPASGAVLMALLRPVLYMDLANIQESRVQLSFSTSAVVPCSSPIYCPIMLSPDAAANPQEGTDWETISQKK